MDPDADHAASGADGGVADEAAPIPTPFIAGDAPQDGEAAADGGELAREFAATVVPDDPLPADYAESLASLESMLSRRRKDDFAIREMSRRLGTFPAHARKAVYPVLLGVSHSDVSIAGDIALTGLCCDLGCGSAVPTAGLGKYVAVIPIVIVCALAHLIACVPLLPPATPPSLLLLPPLAATTIDLLLLLLLLQTRCWTTTTSSATTSSARAARWPSSRTTRCRRSWSNC
jgi:hypothetical protein